MWFYFCFLDISFCLKSTKHLAAMLLPITVHHKPPLCRTSLPLTRIAQELIFRYFLRGTMYCVLRLSLLLLVWPPHFLFVAVAVPCFVHGRRISPDDLETHAKSLWQKQKLHRTSEDVTLKALNLVCYLKPFLIFLLGSVVDPIIAGDTTVNK